MKISFNRAEKKIANTGEKTLESMSNAKFYNKWLLKKFSKYLSGEILEVGSGIGNFSQLLTEFGNVTAIDIDPGYILKTKELLKEKGIVGKGDIEKGRYFFNQKKFDSIVSLNVLEHIKNDDKAFRNIYSILKPKGYLILLLPAHPKLYGAIDESIDHFRRYDKESLLKQLRKNKFKIIKTRRLNFLGAIGWFVSGKILKNKTVGGGKVKLFNIIARPLLFFERFIEPGLGISILVIARK